MKIIYLKFEIVHNARLCTRINEFVVVFCWLLVAYCYLFLTICLIWRQHREKLYTEWRENVERVFLLFTKCHLFDLFRRLFTNYYSTFVGWFRISDLFRICCCSHALYLYLYVRLNVLDARHLVLCRCVVVSLTDNYVWIDGQHDLNIGSVVPCIGGPFFILLSYSSCCRLGFPSSCWIDELPPKAANCRTVINRTISYEWTNKDRLHVFVRVVTWNHFNHPLTIRVQTVSFSWPLIRFLHY